MLYNILKFSVCYKAMVHQTKLNSTFGF